MNKFLPSICTRSSSPQLADGILADNSTSNPKNHFRSFFLGLAGCVALAVAPTSQAALIAYDGFSVPADYTAGNTINFVNGGTGFTSAWSQTANTFNAQNGGLIYTSSGTLSTSAGQATVATNFDFNQSNRTFAPISTGELWVSWLYAPGAVGIGDYAGLGLSRTSGGELFYIGTDGNNTFRIDTSAGGGTGSNATYGALGTDTRFIAVNVSFTNGTVDVYSNPPLTGGPGTATASFSGQSNLAVGSILFLSNGNGQTTFDEIRLGTTFADVAPVPEPSTYVLIGLAGVACFVMKRKKSALA